MDNVAILWMRSRSVRIGLMGRELQDSGIDMRKIRVKPEDRFVVGDGLRLHYLD